MKLQVQRERAYLRQQWEEREKAQPVEKKRGEENDPILSQNSDMKEKWRVRIKSLKGIKG